MKKMPVNPSKKHPVMLLNELMVKINKKPMTGFRRFWQMKMPLDLTYSNKGFKDIVK